MLREIWLATIRYLKRINFRYRPLYRNLGIITHWWSLLVPTMLDMLSGKMYGRLETSLINALLYEELSIEFHRGNVSPILATSCRTRNQKISDRSTVEWRNSDHPRRGFQPKAHLKLTSV